MRIRDGERGQGTVEAALVIPILFLLMLMLIQPGIVLYDYIIIRGTAAELCRFAATVDVNSSEGADACYRFAMNRLAAVPQHEFFHVHDGACTWFVQVEGGETAGYAEVYVSTEIRPLPLIDVALRLFGATNSSGNIEVGAWLAGVEQPSWARATTDASPSEWVGEW